MRCAVDLRHLLLYFCRYVKVYSFMKTIGTTFSHKCVQLVFKKTDFCRINITVADFF